MTPRARTISADDYPALATFCGGYLHQDFVLDYGSAQGALEAYHQDASVRDRAALAKDCARFAEATSDWSWREVKTAVLALGAAWSPRSRAALDAVLTSASTAR